MRSIDNLQNATLKFEPQKWAAICKNRSESLVNCWLV
jgi:hypothetical protein